MKSQVEFNTTLDLPCSVGILAYDIECRVTVAFEAETHGDYIELVDWELIDVRLDGQRGTIGKDDPVFFLFRDAMKDKSQEQIIRDECLDYADQLREAA